MARQKILVVDDELDIVETVKFRLEAAGYEVTTAYDGEEALEQVEKQKPDLIVLDLTMPKMDGTEVCRQLKFNSEHQEIPIVMLTARAQDVDRIEGIGQGADDYITKPFDAKQLIKSIRGILKLKG